MDRDLALKLSGQLTSIKNTLTALATNTIPSAPDSRSASPAVNQRSVPAKLLTAEPAAAPEEEPEADPSEPETRTNK